MSNIEPNELIIVRRRHGLGDGGSAHGGVWKIAYADFMTAMMAFFLVMWLISATDETTRAAMVTYFNPLKLVDSAEKPKGLKDPEDVALPSTRDEGVSAGRPAGEGGLEIQGPTTGGGSDMVAPMDDEADMVLDPTGAGNASISEIDSNKTSADGEDQAKYSEKELFENPYAILAALASDAEAIMQTDGSPGAGGQGALEMAKTPVLFAQPNRDPDGEGLADGTSFRDPFDPSGWQEDPLPGNAPLLAQIPLLERDEAGINVSNLTPEQIKVLEEAVRLTREGKKIPGVELTGNEKLQNALMMIRSKAKDAAGEAGIPEELDPASEEAKELALVLALAQASQVAQQKTGQDEMSLVDAKQILAAAEALVNANKPLSTSADKNTSDFKDKNNLSGKSAFSGQGANHGLGTQDGVDVGSDQKLTASQLSKQLDQENAPVKLIVEGEESSSKENQKLALAHQGLSEQQQNASKQSPLDIKLSEAEKQEIEKKRRLNKISSEINEALTKSKAGASIELTNSSDGVLIRLMDNDKFGMFAIGSAEPKPAVVKAMERIAKVLANEKGDVVIRGHTDGRPFRSKTNDNWRLSMSRAHMAYYMLVRGGLDEKRIVGIEGYADRRLKLKNEPFAPENRRIEIVLLKDKG
ncbi:flagellar motor protein MotB [Polycladidibacter stylochi]|uniref:flagellar motor protein MotB n=1 Tax=Polycladidibacter stylochi TaxID=1807766 RepID=UPI0008316407